MKTKLLGLAVAGMLMGCSTVNQAVRAYGAVAIESTKTANDTLIAGWVTAACATPVSAALRNPFIIPALKSLCIPAVEVSPSHLLEQMEGRQRRQVTP